MWWTLAAAIAGSSTAIFIALWVYPEQKRRDRESEIMRERRLLYRDYASAFKDLYFSQPFQNDVGRKFEFADIGEKEQRFYAVRDAMYIVAPDVVVSSIQLHDETVRKWLIAFNSIHETAQGDIREISRDMMKRFEIVIQRFRADTQSHKASQISWSIRNILKNRRDDSPM
jgi:hypothetical protein